MYVGTDGHTMVISRDTLQEMNEELLGGLLLNKKIDERYPHVLSMKLVDNSMEA